ncbi:hypothetical protein [Flavobacterium soli]|uniref:hypothetical protein n=1 Tax=Flavobacterium soli TaxID=344881 RepID=UPI0004170CE8|nr:hypothetical protein [Flavobacterium soli]
MKNKFFIVFFIVHFAFIFFHSISLVFFDYFEFKKINNKIVDNINYSSTLILNNSATDFYKRYSGLNTGYGFFGINVATESYYKTDIYNKNQLVYTTTNNNLKSKNSLIRFLTIASSEMNSLSAIDDFKKTKNTKTKKSDSLNIENKIKYNDRISKYIGLFNYNNFKIKNIDLSKNCTHYVVTHYCLIPSDIWKYEEEKLKKYILNEKIYYVKN